MGIAFRLFRVVHHCFSDYMCVIEFLSCKLRTWNTGDKNFVQKRYARLGGMGFFYTEVLRWRHNLCTVFQEEKIPFWSIENSLKTAKS